MLSFAVVIPHLNQSHFLISALESLRCQKDQVNLAVMDGGSTDNVNDVVGRYSDIITFFQSGPDNGQAAAIREGFAKVSGDILAWLNADDYYFPGALNKVAECFQNNPKLDVVYGDAVHVTREGFFLSYFPAIQEFNAKELTRSCFICQPACFVRRSAYEAVGGLDSRLHYTMDWDLWCRLALDGARFFYLRDVFAAVRYYPGTKTLSGSRLRYKEIWRIERKYGRRVLPLSWPGFYYYDLQYKKDKKGLDELIYKMLRGLRHLKRRFCKTNTGTHRAGRKIYGFIKGGPRAQGRVFIYVPWFDKRQWKQIQLHVVPSSGAYEVVFNDFHKKRLNAERGLLRFDVPSSEGVTKKISIECLETLDWALLDFRVGLDK